LSLFLTKHEVKKTNLLLN